MYIRSEDMIEATKVARYEPRQTGRTTKMIMSIPFDIIDGKIYIVALHHNIAKTIIDNVMRYRGLELAERCEPVSSKQAIAVLRGVDPFSVFIDHTALEYGDVKDIKYLYSILDAQNIYNDYT